MSALDQRAGRLDLKAPAADDRTWTLDFTGYTITGKTLTATVFKAGTSTTLATLTVTNVDPNTCTVAYNGGDLAPGKYAWTLVNTTDQVTLLAGDFVAERPGVGVESGSATETVSVIGGTATVTVVAGLSSSVAQSLIDASIATHSADTTDVHGIADTSVLATDAEVAAAVAAHEADTSNVHGITDTAALVLRTARLLDRGETFRTKLDSGAACSLTVFGDSTGDGKDEWVYLFGTTEMAASWPALNVDYTLWSDGSQSYPTVTSIRAGTFTAAKIFEDTFTRTASDLYDTVPDLGARWGRDNSAAEGDWSINVTEAVRSSDPTAGTMLVDTGHVGDLTLTVPMTISAPASGSTQTVDFTIKRLDANNRLIATITIASNGAASLAVAKVIAGTTTTIGSVGAALVGTALNQSATFVMTLSGTTLSASVTTVALGTKTASGALLSTDLDALADASVVGVTSTVPPAVKMSSFTVDALSTGSRRALTIRNCSVAGSTISYQAARLATVLATSPDLLVISTGHNAGSQTVAAFLAELDALLVAIRAQSSTCGIAISSQNPQTLGASGRLTHAARQQALRSFCRTRGVGYIPVWETWVTQARRGVDLVGADNTHPTTAGSSLWADAFADYLQSL